MARRQTSRPKAATARKGREGTRTRVRKAPANDPLTVVGIGASAGGLSALRAFFEAMPTDTGMAFVVIQHLDPARRSYLTNLLASYTTMPVVLAKDRTEVAPNTVYVIAPRGELTIQNGFLRIRHPRLSQGARMQIDIFFRSLAAGRGARSIGVILSGTGTDGTLGARAIKEQGGLVVVQDPDDAEYDGMPRSAINTGMADLVLEAGKMPSALVRYSKQHYVRQAPVPREGMAAPDSHFRNILELLHSETSHDFNFYKPGTLTRRIQRRMAMRYIESPAQYLELLRSAPEEVDLLFKDLLINVTKFFRDPEAFKYLAERVLPSFIEDKARQSSLRIWVPGCSTGEEAYSIAMLLIEAITAAKKTIKVQVFASDIDKDALAAARMGLYPESIETDVAEARRSRFFTKEDHLYKVKAELREAVVFARHDVLRDPPFSGLDLISCRNLMIYLKQDTQEKLLSLFQFALRPDGILFLGPSETIGNGADRFEPISRKHRIYRRIGHRRPYDVEFPIAGFRAPPRWHAPTPANRPRPRLAEICQNTLLERFAPASALITPHGDGLYYFGPVARYLEVRGGDARQDLVAMAQEGLRSKLRAAIQEAGRTDEAIVVPDGLVRRDGSTQSVTITAQPVQADGEKLLLISFTDVAEPPRPSPARQRRRSAEADVVERLEQELASTKRELHGTIQELEGSNEELRAANEEAMSVNEELQSVNEELETSKEELQSLNEELTTLNTELQQRVEEQQETSNNLNNILASTNQPTLFLDRNFHIRFFTPATRRLFTIISTDVGRPISDLTRLIDDPTLLDDAKEVLSHLLPIEREVRSDAGQWYNRRTLVYRTADDRIDGVVVTYSDISDLKGAQLALKSARTFADSIVETARDPLIVFNGDLVVLAASRAFHQLLNLEPGAVIGRSLQELAAGALDQDMLRTALERVLRTGRSLEHLEVPLALPEKGERTFQVDARTSVAPPPGETRTILVALQDVTAQQRVKEEQFQSFLDAAPDAMVLIGPRQRIWYFNRQAEALFGWSLADVVGKPLEMLMPSRFRHAHRSHAKSYFEDPQPRMMSQRPELYALTKDGREIPISVSLAPVVTESGTMAAAAVRDVSDQVAAQDSLKKARDAAQTANEVKSRFLAAASHDLRQPLQTLRFLQGILARKVVDPEILDVIGDLGGTLVAMGDALDALLDLSQLETGAVKATIETVPVAPLLGRLRSEFDYAATEKGLRFRVVDSSATARSDARLLERLVQNLVSNAVKYTETGSVLLGCRHRGNKLRIEVWDTGIGIPEEQLEKIFEEFYQLGERANDRMRGFGLGLSVVKRLADLLGHRIDVRSIMGKGSMFAVELPMADQAEAARAARTVISPEPAGEGGTVLLVEDDPVLLDSLRLLFQSEGYTPLAAATADEALALARRKASRPDIVIADHNLPAGRTGIDLGKTLRQSIRSDLPVIILSGDTSPATLRVLADSGFIHLTKPVSSEALLATVDAALGHDAGATRRERRRRPTGIDTGAPDSTEPDRPTVFVVDDDATVRKTLDLLLQNEGYHVETYGSAEAFLDKLEPSVFGCALVDIGLPGLDGMALQEELSKRGSDLAFIMITGRRDVTLAVQAMRRGAVDFLEKPVDSDALLSSVREALAQAGASIEDATDLDELLERAHRLTPREREIMQLMTKGMATKEIARDLNISPRTVEKHRTRILYKMGTDRFADLVRMAVKLESNS